MAETVTPKPMPTTGMPDRLEMPPPPFNEKAGISSDRKMEVNPGRKPGGKASK